MPVGARWPNENDLNPDPTRPTRMLHPTPHRPDAHPLRDWRADAVRTLTTVRSYRWKQANCSVGVRMNKPACNPDDTRPIAEAAGSDLAECSG
jgi:hypothetical protein